MTPKQQSFIRSLIESKDTASLTVEQRAYLAQIQSGYADPGTQAASRIIETLLALPLRAGTASTVEVPEGRYAVVNDAGVTEFFKVDCPTEGKWAGYVFVKQQASDDLYPVKGARKSEVLGRIAVDPQAAMVRYGQELGSCGRCGRTLTDEVSRATGIGPECAAILGIDRPSVESVVAPKAPTPAEVVESHPVFASFSPETRATIAANAETAKAVDVTVRRDPIGDVPTLGWRERKSLIKQQQSDAAKSRGDWHERAVATGRIHEGELPGSTWEDIFRMGEGA